MSIEATEVERIAEGLTEAQREAVSRLGDDRYRRARDLKVYPIVLHSLWSRRPGPNLEAPKMIVSREPIEHPLAYGYKLSPLGIAVRSHLMKGQDHE